MKNARETALAVLYKIEYEDAYSNLALKEGIPEAMSKADKAFVTGLVYGTVARKLTLDGVIARYSSVKLKKLSKYVRLILWLGLYQMMYMDRVPDSAAVNESVKLAKKYAARSAGFVNGILRSAAREGTEPLWSGDPVKDLSVRYSFPEWISRRWLERWGHRETERLMDALNQPPAMTIRVNRLKTNVRELTRILEAEGATVRPDPLYSKSLRVSGADLTGKAFLNGLYTAQDTAASMAAAVLDPKPGEAVIDLCAAPGGKTTHIAELMEDSGSIRAFDIYEHKLRLIEENAKRLGIKSIRAEIGDGTVYDPRLEKTADKVLADVPCSGLGIIRRKPEIKYRRSEEDSLLAVQRRILENAARYVKVGGELIYSTCTIEPEENTDVIQAFLENHREFVTADISGYFPETMRKKTMQEGYVTLYPHIDGTDGFFICKLKKNYD